MQILRYILYSNNAFKVRILINSMAKTLEEFKEEIKNAPLSGLIRKLIILEASQNDELKLLPRDGQIKGDKTIPYDELKSLVCLRYTPYIKIISETLDKRERGYEAYLIHNRPLGS